jgi:hypothetical protein
MENFKLCKLDKIKIGKQLCGNIMWESSTIFNYKEKTLSLMLYTSIA